MKEVKSPKIALVGVGRSGTKVVNVIANSELSKDIRMVTVCAFEYETTSSDADVKIVLYKGRPFSLHQPIPQSVARDAALEVYDEIKEALMQ